MWSVRSSSAYVRPLVCAWDAAARPAGPEPTMIRSWLSIGLHFGLRGVLPPRFHGYIERQQHLAEADDVAVRERALAGHFLAVDERAVAAADVLDDEAVRGSEHACVIRRHAAV